MKKVVAGIITIIAGSISGLQGISGTQEPAPQNELNVYNVRAIERLEEEIKSDPMGGQRVGSLVRTDAWDTHAILCD